MRLLIAGGGTGGHVFPALAVAEELSARGAEHTLLFVGTEAGFEAGAVRRAGFEIDFIRVSGLKRVSVLKRLAGFARLPISFIDSLAALRRFRPNVVLGVGGYASGPVVLCARSLGLPTAICEQNSIPGFTNRVLGRVVHKIFISFASTQRFFAERKVVLSGNPVRRALRQPQEQPASSDRLHVLVLGGSQGARPLNHGLPAGFAHARQQGLHMQIVHQTGEADVVSTRQAYTDLNVEAEVVPFVDDMAARYAASDLLIGRAGATTCAEITALGLPSILIPFPQAADDHQTVNAQDLVDAGAARLLPQEQLSPEALFGLLQQMSDDDQRACMAAAARKLGRPDAAARVVDGLQELAERRSQ